MADNSVGGGGLVDVGCGFGLYNVYVSRHYSGRSKIVYFDDTVPTPVAADGHTGRKTISGYHKKANQMSFYRSDPACTHALAGFIAAWPEALVVTPFQVVKVRLQTKELLSRYRNCAAAETLDSRRVC